MPTRGGDLQRALGALLPLDVAQVGQRARRLAHRRPRPRQHLRALEMIGELDQRARRDHVQVGRGPGRLRAAGGGADQPEVQRARRHGGRQHAGDRRQAAIERQFAQHHVLAEHVGGYGADRRHDAERDRQVVVAALLGEVGGREIDDDALGRHRQAGGEQRRAHPLLGLGHRLVAEPDDGEEHVARGDLHLDIDRPGLDALERDRRDTHYHRLATLRMR